MAARKVIKAIDDRPDRRKTLQQLSVSTLYTIKSQDLFPKDVKDGIGSVTVFDSDSERVVHEVYSRLSGVASQSNTKNFIRERRGGEWAAARRHGDVKTDDSELPECVVGGKKQVCSPAPGLYSVETFPKGHHETKSPNTKTRL
jgi:hypothetical protein